MELTLEQLTKNMCKGTTNYIRLVRLRAFIAVVDYNDMVKHRQNIIKETREYHKTNPSCIVHPNGYKYYSHKKRDYVYYTIYTKAPRFRTYRQQLAITYRQLEAQLQVYLKNKDCRTILFYH